MITVRHDRVRQIFDEAIGLPDSERASFVKRACEGDQPLAAAVSELLAALADAGPFLAEVTLDEPLSPTDSTSAPAAIPPSANLAFMRPTSVGPYRLLEKIGEGGFGEVWAAEQEQPRRKVALKVIKAGMDSREVLARFDAERQALALMDHLNIAKIFDAGQTDGTCAMGAGRPYFVMEHIPGLPITDYCDASRLPIRRRLELFVLICHAVQHAHQRGVIHRDLKPSNIPVTLIDAKPVPKVIDFGIAKATTIALTDRTLHTGTGRLMGTPEYMSPEQAGTGGLDVDTRTDVYSLGVILYQLLTGTLPFDPKSLRSARCGELTRIIREMEPPRPSARLSTLRSEPVNRHGAATPQEIAARRETGFVDLQRQVRGELDWIVMKCLEKDRTRRYDTVNNLAADVQRYLSGDPVAAAPPSRLYRARKALRRYRVAATILAGFVTTILAGSAIAVSQWWRAETARNAEAVQFARAEAVSAFLKEMLTAADPARTRGEKVTVREALDEATKTIDRGALDGQALVEADLRATIGQTYFKLGMYAQAEVQLRAANALYTQNLGAEHPGTLRISCNLAEVLSWMSDYAEALPLAESTLATQTRTLGAEHPDTQQTMLILGQLLPWADSSRFAEAESLLTSVLEHRERTLGREHIETARAMHILGEAYTVGAYPEKGEPLHRTALRIHSQVLGPEHPETLEAEYSLACALINAVRSSEAEGILRRLLETRRRVQGPDHLGTLGAMAMLGASLNAQSRYHEAEPFLRENLAGLRRTVGPDHTDNVSTRRYLARSLEGQGRNAEAEAVLREALEVSLRRYGPEHADTTIRVMAALARSLELQGKDAEAERVARQVLEIQRRQKPHPLIGELSKSIRALSGILKRRGETEEARTLEEELIGLALAIAREPDASPQNLHDAARLLLFTEFPILRDVPLAMELTLEANRSTGFRNQVFLHTLAQAHALRGDSARAKEVWEQAFAQLANERTRAAKMNSAAWWLLSRPPDEPRDSRLALEFALQANELTGNANPTYLDTLALAYFQIGDTAQAIELQKKALSLLAADAPDRAKYEDRLVELEQAVGAQR